MEVTVFKPKVKTTTEISFSPIDLNPEYRKKWNAKQHDYICLTRGGEPINNNVYRKGGLFSFNPETDNYFIIIKCVEAVWPDKITKVKKDKNHLSTVWCIYDKWGNEKIQKPESLSYLSLVKNSCIYSDGSHYYNIETKEYYGESSDSMETDTYLWIDTRSWKDKENTGIKQINKKDGTFTLFK